MAVVRNLKWLFAAAVLLAALAAILIVRGSDSDSPVRAASEATDFLGIESRWNNLDGALGQEATYGDPTWSDASSVKPASKLVPQESKWSAIRPVGNVARDATLVTQEPDKGTDLPLDTQSNGSVSGDPLIQLASPSGQSDGKSVHMTTTAVVLAAPEAGDDGTSAP